MAVRDPQPDQLAARPRLSRLSLADLMVLAGAVGVAMGVYRYSGDWRDAPLVAATVWLVLGLLGEAMDRARGRQTPEAPAFASNRDWFGAAWRVAISLVITLVAVRGFSGPAKPSSWQVLSGQDLDATVTAACFLLATSPSLPLAKARRAGNKSVAALTGLATAIVGTLVLVDGVIVAALVTEGILIHEAAIYPIHLMDPLREVSYSARRAAFFQASLAAAGCALPGIIALWIFLK